MRFQMTHRRVSRVRNMRGTKRVRSSRSSSSFTIWRSPSSKIPLVAAVVDSMILGIPLLVATLVWGTFALDGGDAAPRSVPTGSLAVISIGFPLLCLLYYVFFWGARGATPGKSLLGLSVQTEEGDSPIGFRRAVIRVVGYMVSTVILGLGFVMIAFSDDKRALHDRIAGTRVMRNF